MTATSAPAKIILFGEHAVVHGQPAIAVPVSTLRATATVHDGDGSGGLRIRSIDLDQVLPVDLETELVDSALALTARLVLRRLDAIPPDALITLESTIPMASGLGSGAAVSAALARAVALAVGYDLPPDELNAIVFEIEKSYHGTPSGIDNTVIVYEQPVYFVRGAVEILPIARPFTLVVADTGEASLTRVAVGDVRRLVEREPARIRPILDAIGDLTQRARSAITGGNVTALGPLMTRNHELLRELTVSSDSLERLVAAAQTAGALGAKLSGGGRGGNMIALISPDTPQQAEAVRRALLAAGATRAFITSVEPVAH